MPMPFLALAAVLLALSGGADTSAPSASGAGPAGVGNAAQYAVGPGDKLKVQVRAGTNATSDDTEAIVAANGTLDLNYLGPVLVAGLSTQDIGRKLRGLYIARKIYNECYVAVNVTEYVSQGVTVGGFVGHPQRVVMRGPTRLLDVLAAAGGIDEAKGGFEIRVQRAGLDKALVVRKSGLYSPDATVAAAANIEVQNGDSIYVPARLTFCIQGAVKNVGCFDLEEDMNLLQAISTAGGLAPNVDPHGVVIRRRDATGATVEIPADLDEIGKGALPPAINGSDLILMKERSLTRFCIRGPVMKPDCYDFDFVGVLTLDRAISKAGGLDATHDPDQAHVTIRRTIDGTPQELVKSLDVAGPDGAQFPIQPNDEILVGQAQSVVTVMGAVKNPSVINFRKGMTMADALALAGVNLGDPQGGPLGRLKKVLLTRKGQVQEVNAKAIFQGAPDVPLEPGDKIFVPRSLM